MCIRVSVSVLMCAYVYSCVWVCTHVCVCVWVDPRMALALLCLPFCLFVVCLPVKITALTLHSELTNVYNTNDVLWELLISTTREMIVTTSSRVPGCISCRLQSTSTARYFSWKQFTFILSPIHSVWLAHTMLLHLMFWPFSKVYFYLFILTYCPYLLNYYPGPHNWNHI